MYKLSLLLVVMYFNSLAYAQDTLNVGDPKPFDKAFILKYPSNNKEKAKGASLFEVNGKGCLKSPRACFNFKNLIPFKKKDVISVELNVVRQDTIGNVYISVPPLEPDKEYFLILNYAIKPERLDEVYDLIDKGKSVDAEELFDTLRNSSSRTFNTRFGNECNCGKPDTFSIAPFSNQARFYDSVLKQLQLQIADKKKQKNDIITNIKLCPFNKFSIEDAFLKAVILYTQKCIQCADTVWEYQALGKPGKNIIPLLLSLKNIDSSITQGFIELDDLGNPVFINVVDINIEKRLANLSNSINELSQLIKLFDYLNLKFTINNYAYNRGNIYDQLTCLNNNFKLLSQQKLNIGKIDKDINRLIALKDGKLDGYEGLWLPAYGTVSNTFTYGFETRSGWVVKPDFGFMVYGGIGQYKNFWGFSPYLGFHVNFRPLNSEIGYSTIRHKGLTGHLSFNGGALISSLKEEGKRDGLIGSTSIFTGLGWAFSHAVRINSGAVWYKKLDPNPLITTKTISAIPYLGLSIDLRLHDIYNTFTKLFN